MSQVLHGNAPITEAIRRAARLIICTSTIVTLAITFSGCGRGPDEACKDVPQKSSYDSISWDEDRKDVDVWFDKSIDRMNKCIHHESYRLSVASGSVEDISDAVIEVCRGHIVRLGFVAGLIDTRDGAGTSGFDTEKDVEAAAMKTAKMRVIEARALRCGT